MRVAPAIQENFKFRIPEVIVSRLKNGIEVHALGKGPEEVMRLDAVIMAGRPWEKVRLASRSTVRMLREGTKRKTGELISNRLDFLGANLSISENLDFALVTLSGLSKDYIELVEIFSELILEPTFPEKELETWKNQGLQKLAMDLADPDSLTYRGITESVFGKNHVYGYNSSEEDYKSLQVDQLKEHYLRTFTPSRTRIFFYFPEKNIPLLMDALESNLGSWKSKSTGLIEPNVLLGFEPIFKEKLIILPDSVQTSIKLAKHLFPRNHPDYPKFFMMNIIFGGYFGSRLMTNIREKKGYTYSIYSTMDTFLYDGFFYISTDVDHKYKKATLRAVIKEIELLKNEPVELEELRMAKNYLFGNMLNALDGPFQTLDFYKSLILDNLSSEIFQQWTQILSETSPLEIKEMANKYFSDNHWHTWIAGK
jgi:zinc protease